MISEALDFITCCRKLKQTLCCLYLEFDFMNVKCNIILYIATLEFLKLNLTIFQNKLAY